MRKYLLVFWIMILTGRVGSISTRILSVSGLESGPLVNRAATTSKRGPPSVVLRKAPLMQFPGTVDCNSPGHWDGDTFYLFTSSPGPMRSSGRDPFHLGAASRTHHDREVKGGIWIEATYKAPDGILYGWYHNEPQPVCANSKELTAPRIGAARSPDNGTTWQDLGFVLEAPSGSLYCATQNKYFAGGNGDFSVILDNEGEYFYFFASTYHRSVSEQGVSVARMRYPDRDKPVGNVWKWHMGKWNEPGIGGHVSPIFPVSIDWHRKKADAFWGPSVHWNSYLGAFVVLLNHAIDGDWKQEGIYVTFNSDLNRPASWTAPKKILDAKDIAGVPKMEAGWYPQVVGMDPAKWETDKLAGRLSRLFVHGKSEWEMTFEKP